MQITERVHPGNVLREDFLEPMKLSAYSLAKAIDVPVNRITMIINEERAITPETSVLLARYFNVSDELWAELQMSYDVEQAKHNLAAQIALIRPYNYNPQKYNNDLWLPT